MVAIAILGVAIVAIFQLFSITLRSTQRADDYTKALFYARSMLDEAYSVPDPTESSDTLEFQGNFEASKDINLKSSSEDEKLKLYEIIVTVNWPPSGSLKIKGLRAVYEEE
jgi:Tfp pilus assembly protein PilV